ncbi:MAG: hypothetical protein WBH00_13120 [Xanthobacteraceae bacterium]
MFQVMDRYQISKQPPCSTQAIAAKQARAKSRWAELVAAFMAARRAARVAKTKYDELAANHPDLCVDDPIIFLFTNGEGKPIYGDFRDIHRFFPASQDEWSPRMKAHRERLMEQYGEARVALTSEQKSVGLYAAQQRLNSACYVEKRCFLAICQYRPSTLREAREQARVVRTYLPQIATSHEGEHVNLYTQKPANYDEWKSARSDAFDYLAALALAICNAGGR